MTDFLTTALSEALNNVTQKKDARQEKLERVQKAYDDCRTHFATLLDVLDKKAWVPAGRDLDLFYKANICAHPTDSVRSKQPEEGEGMHMQVRYFSPEKNQTYPKASIEISLRSYLRDHSNGGDKLKDNYCAQSSKSNSANYEFTISFDEDQFSTWFFDYNDKDKKDENRNGYKKFKDGQYDVIEKQFAKWLEYISSTALIKNIGAHIQNAQKKASPNVNPE